jgi:hypothetical protein
MAGLVVGVEVGEEDAGHRPGPGREPVAERDLDLEGLEVHLRRDHPAEGGLVRVVAVGPLDAGVHQKEAAGRVAQGVEVDLDRLEPVLQAGGAGPRVVEVEEPLERDHPVGRGDRLELDGTWLIDDGEQLPGRPGDAER